jgi:hypothetical protein
MEANWNRLALKILHVPKPKGVIPMPDSCSSFRVCRRERFGKLCLRERTGPLKSAFGGC